MKLKMTKFGLGLLCAVLFGSAAGCGNKGNESDAKTPAQAEAFKGHQPTPEQLQAAIAKSSQHAATPGQPSAPKQ